MSNPNETLAQTESNPQKVERTKTRTVFAPAIDILEQEDALILRADLPGAVEKTTDITLENGVLTIRAEVAEAHHREGTGWLQEYVPGDYERSFTISDEIDQEHIEAHVKDGVLTLRLPKAAPARPRKIQVVAG